MWSTFSNKKASPFAPERRFEILQRAIKFYIILQKKKKQTARRAENYINYDISYAIFQFHLLRRFQRKPTLKDELNYEIFTFGVSVVVWRNVFGHRAKSSRPTWRETNRRDN